MGPPNAAAIPKVGLNHDRSRRVFCDFTVDPAARRRGHRRRIYKSKIANQNYFNDHEAHSFLHFRNRLNTRSIRRSVRKSISSRRRFGAVGAHAPCAVVQASLRQNSEQYLVLIPPVHRTCCSAVSGEPHVWQTVSDQQFSSRSVIVVPSRPWTQAHQDEIAQSID